MDSTPARLFCKVCQSDARKIGTKKGIFEPREFALYRCGHCGFSFVGNPWTQYEVIYSDAYYAGEGADPLVDYAFELEHPESTIRQYEWKGILRVVRELVTTDDSTQWLDFGCGNGGLVRHCRANGIPKAVGFEDGAIRNAALASGIPILSIQELAERKGTFDVVTSIEVLEHTEDPVAVLTQIRSFLRPGGLFFYTTGNAAPHRSSLTSWSYFTPELHISLFEPQSLTHALMSAGFRPESRGYLSGFTDIIRFKVLKTLKMRRTSAWERAIPWSLASRLVDRRHCVTAHPIGWAK
jgi:2-polyprenyl-3-methyl-5-hydroxy-6-metoxy-1,4-benzoquinol methylase